jgi:hypothetical protein
VRHDAEKKPVERFRMIFRSKRIVCQVTWFEAGVAGSSGQRFAARQGWPQRVQQGLDAEHIEGAAQIIGQAAQAKLRAHRPCLRVLHLRCHEYDFLVCDLVSYLAGELGQTFPCNRTPTLRATMWVTCSSAVLPIIEPASLNGRFSARTSEESGTIASAVRSM